MVDAVGTVTKIVELALAINDAVDTVRQNKVECRQIATRVERLRAIVAKLEKTDVPNDKTMSDALSDLEDTFRQALKLVMACQAKNIVWLFFRTGNVSKKLRQVKEDVVDHMTITNFCNNIHTTVMYTTGTGGPPPNAKKLSKEPSMQGEQEMCRVGSRLVLQETNDAGEVEDSHSSYLTDGTRSEVNGEKVSFPAGSLEDALSRFTNFSSSELRAATKNFSKQHVIGNGGSAIVYRGVLPKGGVVAIKKFRVDYSQDEPVAHYARVFSVLHEHENVVRFLGYCHEMKMEMVLFDGKCVAAERRDMLVVEEFMPKGTLSELIDGLSQQLDWPSTFRIIRGIALGVAHIHRQEAVHLDLKPANILLDSDMNPKICDFERSKILDQKDEDVAEKVTKEFAGTLGYLPPEYVADGIISPKHDVFSFGVLLLHTISKSGLLQDSTDWVRDALEGQDVNGLLDPSLRDESELNEIKRCKDIGLVCTAKERADRPTMRNVVEMLDGKEQLRTPMRNKASSFKKKGRA